MEAVIPLTGRPEQFVRVPEAGVPNTGEVRVGLVRVLFVRVSVELTVGTFTPSTVSLPAAPLAKVVSEAWPSSIVPTPRAEVVEAVIPLTGRSVQFVKVPDDGVPRIGVVSVGLVRVLLVRVSVELIVGTFTPSTVSLPAAPLASVVSETWPSSMVEAAETTPVTPRVPPIVALPVTGKLEAVPALITLERVTFFKAVAEASYIRSRSLA